MKKIGWLVVALLTLTLTGVSAEVVSRIAAVVNDDIITTYQLDQALNQHLAGLERQPSPAQLAPLRRQLLDRLIEETLVKQRIRALNLTVSEEEVETALLDVQKQNQLTREELKEAVLAQGMTFEAYQANLRQQILRYKLISAEVRSKVDVSEQEIVEYYRAHLDEYRYPDQIRLSALSLPIPAIADGFQREAIEIAAAEAAERLQTGEEFETVVEAYQDEYDAEAATMGSFAPGEMSGDFVAAVEPVGVGGYSDPVVTGDAILILRVDAREPGGLRPFDAVKNDIYQLISDQKTDARIKEWTKSLEKQAFIDIRL